MWTTNAIIAVDAALLLLAIVTLRASNQKKNRKTKSFSRLPVAQLPALQNDDLIRASYGKAAKRIPVWMMRQAGRYLPEFRALRVEHEFFKVCQTPELACRLTLQPLERFGPGLLSACIIFSDILVVPQAMGMQVEMIPGKGPVFLQRLERPSDAVKRLVLKPNVETTLGYVFDALNLTRQELKGRVPLIGFSGAPFTLMAYMIEGGGSKTLSRAKRFLYEEPEESHALLQAITDVVVEYLVRQVTLGGAQALQVFESNAGDLSPRLWNDFSYPYLAQIAKRVKTALGESQRVPLIVFSRGSNWEGTLEALSETEYDTISLDWTIDPRDARQRVNGRKSLQGNLDTAALYAPPEIIRQETFQMLSKFGTKQGLIANLGHGMEPEMDPANAKAFLQAIKDFSESSLL